MPAYKDQVDLLVQHRVIDNSDYIVPGHSKVKPKYIIPLGPVVMSKFSYNVFLFQFSPQGLTIFVMDEKNQVNGCQIIYWKDVKKFKVRNGLLENTMILETSEEKLNLKLSKRVLGSPWVNENIERLSACNYFYNNAAGDSLSVKKEEVELPDNLDSEEIIIHIAECISNKDSEVIHALKLCIQDEETYKSVYYDGNRAYTDDDLTGEELQWIALADNLSIGHYVCELDYKCSLEDFLYNFCQLKGLRFYPVATEGIMLNERDCITDWCTQLDRAWNSQDVCIAAMDIDSDSYVIFPVTLAEFAYLRELAARIGKIINHAADM